ncbi:dihydrolipoamide acetyltransferase family protein [Alkalicoccobacillus plakortidis]|uniref:Dihydrolipoamide acetyltransferase component of pyruvate dehydrogenase complex n=1 Tax=Alkalicoccobacillus plakortidis TaxID=444060 RepID=A0ABT0XJP8_9BACI|nr:dihydrolipoamide acetyltransferase family protein [Alkalicoccobacillus plakortidis]MCM2676128.1 2-oxo acid dehydrogenase subunit E2 [Alkalicoccobacillus plakortidis]
MPKEIFMPKLSSTMQVGTLLEWFKEEGDSVEIGEPLFEIMTDKINIEVEAYEEGTLLKRYVGEDDEVPVNYVIGYIGRSDEPVPDTSPGVSDSDSQAGAVAKEHPAQVEANDRDRNHDEKVRATPAARRVAKQESVTLSEVDGSGPRGRVQEADVYAHLEQPQIKATPLARKISDEIGIDLGEIEGTGPNGKVYKSDVEAKASTNVTKPITEAKRMKLSGTRKMIAKRMVESAFTAPHVTLTSEVDMSAAMDLRQQLLASIEQQTGKRLSYTEIIAKATANTLTRHPEMNVSLERDEVVYHNDVHIGLAVSIPGGLVVPVIKSTNQKGLTSLTEEAKQLATAARDGKLSPDSMKGGTFTISNLGMYAVDAFTPIINQPESAILGVGRIQEKAVGVNGQIELRPMMSISLSFDHRVIDGAPAAAFLTELKHVLENPYHLLT